MTKAIAIACSLAACVAVFTATVAAMSREGEPDRLCQLLFEEYVVGRGKINGTTRTAASDIVAERGRNAGFWRDVLRELQEDDEETEMGCVRVLGKMLEIDARARDSIRRTETTGETTAWRPSIEVGNEVIEELIARAGKADRFRVDAYAIALARARVPEACAFFRAILQDDAGKQHLESAKFHAAVGLAQCGDPAGFRWLIENSSDPSQTVSNAWPERDLMSNLDACCIAALQDLSGQRDLRTRQDCESWWKLASEEPPAHGRVRLVEH
jgi:hypothetical protein